MGSLKEVIKQEYLKLKDEEMQSDIAILNSPFKVIDPLEAFQQSRNEDTVLCARNMAMLYLVARLCKYDKSYLKEAENLLLAVNACISKVLDKQYTKYIFLKIALCDAEPTLDEHISTISKPKFLMFKIISDTDDLSNYILRISNTLLSSNYKWYGKKFLKNAVQILQAEKFKSVSNKEKVKKSIECELKKYTNVKEEF